MRRILDKNGRRIITRLLIIAAMSFVTMAFIEWRFFGNDYNRLIDFFTYKHLVFWYNTMLLFFIELIVSCFFKKPWTGPGVMFIAAIIVSYITVQKQNFRGQPLLPEDFMLADQTGTITKFIDFGSLIRTILACLLTLGLIILLNYLTKTFFDVKDRKEPKRFWNKNLHIFRFVILVVGITGFVHYSDFAVNHAGGRYEDIPQIQSYFIAWNQMYNYETNGFILGFLYNWSKLDLKAPDGYSEDKIAEIKDMYLSEETEEKKKTLSEEDYNIVVILDESFSDPSVVSNYYHITPNNLGGKNSMDIEITEDVTPVLRNLINNDKQSKNYAIGQMYSIDYGGGTANIEFEVDTTMSNYFLNTVPFVDLLPHTESVPSIYQIAKNAGYNTLAIHPFNGGMYKRNIALKKEGIDRFIDESEMEYTDKDDNREYINDRSAYKETLSYLKNNNNKMIVSLITMQNHAGYYTDGYSFYSYNVEGDVSAREKEQLQVYLESLHNSDYYLGEFLEELKNFDEKTVVLWYGDHYPGIIETVEKSEDKSVRDLSRVTPYLIWANFDLEDKTYDNIQRFNQTNTNLPTTTPNCLTNTMFDLLNLEKPSYMKLVNEVCAETPILAQAYYSEEGPFKSTTFSNYELFTYDVLGGSQYWFKR